MSDSENCQVRFRLQKSLRVPKNQMGNKGAEPDSQAAYKNANEKVIHLSSKGRGLYSAPFSFILLDASGELHARCQVQL